MPTAVEYAVVNNWHTQNGAGGGPPAQQEATVVQLPPAVPSGDWLFTGPLAALFLVAAVVAAIRHRTGRAAPSGHTRVQHC